VDRHRREERADDAERQGERPTLDEVVGDARFLRCRRRVNLAKDLNQIALGPIRPVDEGKNSDEQRKERDQREKDLVRDRAREEAALVVGEALDGRPRASSDAG
jgi:hypothetical protein